MLLVKTPLRISFFGGGSDIEEWFDREPGLTLSTTIDKYIYLAVNQCVAYHVKAVYSVLELEPTAETIKHDRIRHALKYFNINSNIEIASFSDVPTKGTGLGSSSTFTVALVHAIYKLKKERDPSSNLLAAEAYWIERILCGEKIGIQDQLAAAHGGFNLIRYEKLAHHVSRATFSDSVKRTLENRLVLINTGISRHAATVLNEQIENYSNVATIEIMRAMVRQAGIAYELLLNGQVDDFGEFLNEAWKYKKKLSGGITNPEIDALYEKCLAHGALGGKLLGAGGGGYLLVYVPENWKTGMLKAIEGYETLPFKFTEKGSEIVYAA